ncbi:MULTISPECIES: ribosomal L7Ae/L30e/S12e/Gadd45 family protein [Lactobacillus]|uniref:50S ribosomal protein L7 n=1 Tax=Lactobacillus xujianguonis TaxID=2495899 RepID=A0A437SXD1_9LACO|nr:MULTISPECIES: ribosomal L7Ae/L30e/S12e/Gadd45 family protein [Lactobacillus]RVU71572.1 50S ribosomal protein L7 [Lactobacillus xujianguonis]RVU77776.1 50S ribosomal protein L7 [Lactobacillus xujianguonis]
MQNKQKALNLLGLAMRAGKVIAGTETVIMGLAKQKVKVVIIASDLHENSLEKVNRAVRKANVQLVDLFTADELAHAIGKKRKVIGITDQGFAKALAKNINEGV